MEPVPAGRVSMATLARALPLSAAVASGAPFRRNRTVPVGVPDVGEVTVATSVTVWPRFDGFGVEVTTVVVAAPVAALITCETAGEVLGAKAPPPVNIAVIECVPAGRVVVVKVACAEPFRTPEPIAVPPLRKLTVPVAVPEVALTVAVKVTA